MIKALQISLLLVVLSSCASVDANKFERGDYIRSGIADCESPLKLDGTKLVEICAPPEKECIPAAKVVYDYCLAAKYDNTVYGINMQASPWHLYDSSMRILTVEDVAEIVKPQLGPDVKRIVLFASWTGVSPDPNGKSLAQKLSDLIGLPVSGMDGFLWLAKDGAARTTHQAFTMKRLKYPYMVHPGDEVMVSLAAGWFIEFEEDYVKEKNAEGILRAGAGWDIFVLCPERALQSFEAAAKLSNPIAAYNAALIRLERNKDGDLETATKLLKQAAALGDEKAQALLQKMIRQGR
jgi:TPR repeat protein